MNAPITARVLRSRLAVGLRITVVAVLALGVIAAPPEGRVLAQGTAPDHTIHLRSRQFQPAPGLEPALAQYFRDAHSPRVHALLQLDADLTPDLQAVLAEHGISLQTYIPDRTWLATVPASASALRAVPGVRALAHFATDDKLSPGLGAADVPEWARRPGDRVAAWVTYHPDVSAAAATARVVAHGGTVTAALPEMHRLEVDLPPNAARGLAAEDAIQWLSEAPPPKVANNDGARTRVGMNTVQGAGTLLGAGVAVGEWDAGRVFLHGDFASRTTVVDTGAVMSDHATHVAGTVLGDGIGAARARGMAPAAHLFSYDWNDPVAEHLSGAGLGIELSTHSWTYGADARAGTCYGAYAYDAPDYDAIVRGRYGKEILVLFAAGNSQQARDGCSRSVFDKINVPATAKNIVTVGAVNSDDGTIASFSSFGPTDDGRIKPEVTAPGCESGGEGGIYSTLPDNGYAAWCGTSMATPATTGVAAVLYEAWRVAYAAGDPNVDPLPSTIKAVLIGTALDGGTVGPDYKFGFGSIDALAGTRLIGTGRRIIEARDGIGTGQSRDIEIVTDGSGPLRATLVWSDKEAAPNASKTLVNDLDLVLVSPSGTQVSPWVLNPAKASTAATRGADHTNVVEQVEVTTPVAGVWIARVRGQAVPVGTQHYSLVISGGDVADMVDVAVVDVRAPAMAATGRTVQVAVDVANHGTSDVATTLSLADTTAGTPIGTAAVDLLPGRSATYTFDWTVPDSAALGPHMLEASVPTLPGEVDAADNRRSVWTEVRSPVHDVAVVSVTAAPDPVAPGDVVQVTVRARNEGDYAETAMVSVTESPDSVELGTLVAPLDPGATVDLTFSWATTGGASIGTHTLAALAAPVAGETDTADNQGSGAVTITDRVAVTRVIGSGADDVHMGCLFEAATSEVTVGLDTRCQPNAKFVAGYRFTALPIPPGATILSAALEFTSASNYTNLVTTRIAAEASGAPSPFSSIHPPNTVAKTTAGVDWSISGAWTYPARVSSPSIVAVLQELVDRPDWATGAPMNIVIETISAKKVAYPHRRVFAFERDNGAGAAALTLEFAP